MKTLVTRLFLLVIAWLALTYYVFPWSSYDIQAPFTWEPYKLGLDLQGWIELDYKVDLTEAKAEKDYNRDKEKSII